MSTGALNGSPVHFGGGVRHGSGLLYGWVAPQIGLESPILLIRHDRTGGIQRRLEHQSRRHSGASIAALASACWAWRA
jgi:hypothetical protein